LGEQKRTTAKIVPTTAENVRTTHDWNNAIHNRVVVHFQLRSLEAEGELRPTAGSLGIESALCRILQSFAFLNQNTPSEVLHD
jgi:hypothetical protein